MLEDQKLKSFSTTWQVQVQWRILQLITPTDLQNTAGIVQVFVPSQEPPLEGAILTCSIYLPIWLFLGLLLLVNKGEEWETLYPQEKIAFPWAFIWLKVNSVATQDIGPLTHCCKEGRLRLSWGEISSSYQDMS